MEQYNIHLNLAGIHAPADRAIHKAIYMAHLGLKQIEGIQDTAASIGTESQMNYKALNKYTSTKDMIDDYRSWILASVFRDVVEAIGECCTEAYQALLIIQHMAPSKGVTFSPEIFKKQILSPTATFRKMVGLPKKIERLAALSPGVLPNTTEHAKSINMARNCLVHRHGLVGHMDVNTLAQSSLHVRWKRPSLFLVTNDDTELPLNVGDLVEAEGRLRIKWMEGEKMFRIGARIEFTEDELVGICMSISCFAGELAMNVEKAGSLLGWSFTQPTQSSRTL